MPLCTFRATDITSSSTRPEPAIADRARLVSPARLIPARREVLPPRPTATPASSTVKATPRLAPELIPSTNGPASGLRNRVCICNPLTESAAPASIAVNALGRRNFSTMVAQAGLEASPPSSTATISSIGMRTEPTAKLNRKTARAMRANPANSRPGVRPKPRVSDERAPISEVSREIFPLFISHRGLVRICPDLGGALSFRFLALQ